MTMNTMIDDIEADFDIMETAGVVVEKMLVALVPARAIDKTLRQWLSGRGQPGDFEDALGLITFLAADLEMFTPSTSGVTAVDRYLGKQQPATAMDRLALDVLRSAQFRLVKIIGREGPDLVRLKDLVSGDSFQLLDSRMSPHAAGLVSAMRLCRLPSGRHMVISPLFAIDQTMLDHAMTFVRPGRALGNGYRCAASLYREVARRGAMPMPILEEEIDGQTILEALADLDDRITPVDRLALFSLGGDLSDAELIVEVRQLTSVDNLIDACGLFGQAGDDAPEGLKAAYERIADLMMETLVYRARAGAGPGDTIDAAGAAISTFIARGQMEPEARRLFDRLRARWSVSTSSGRGATAELDGVLQRIRGLRAKTVESGCTEEEAMAAAAKVSELLARHDLTLDEISVRQSDCEGMKIATGRKRSAPVDSCMPVLADFCDCRVWSEEGEDGTRRYVFFGLKADVEAARFLHDLIEVTFDTESVKFRRGDIYQGLRGGDRRLALTSFQMGLAGGINAKLTALKEARSQANAKTTGFDLVALKHTVVDDEVEKLGLNFTQRAATSRRYIHGEAYQHGKAQGALFEPHAAVEG